MQSLDAASARAIAPAGVTGIAHVQVTPDGRAYVYNYFRVLSDLSLLQGVK